VFEYKARAQGDPPIAAGTYTFINHHGSAYAVSVVRQDDFNKAKRFVLQLSAEANPDEEALTLDIDNAATFYWHLRFALVSEGIFSDDAAFERLRTLDAPSLLNK